MQKSSEIDTVQIRNKVIGSIASLAAQEVEGVAGVWGGIWPLTAWAWGPGVRVEVQDQEVRVWLSLIAEYGFNLPQVAAQVRDRVREMIERMTALTAAEVHVKIHHVKPRRSSARKEGVG